MAADRFHTRLGIVLRLPLLLALAALALTIGAEHATASTIVVNSTNDPGDGTCDITECTLREAIVASNASIGVRDTITFSIGTGPQTIIVGTPTTTSLPQISDPATLDATSQPGFSGTPIIEIKQGSSGFDSGIRIFVGDTMVRGFVINSFHRHGIWILSNPGGNVVAGNYLGTDLVGNTNFQLANGLSDVQITNSPNNRIGGSSTTDRNLINDDVTISGSASTANHVGGNYIGTDAAGMNMNTNGGLFTIESDAPGNFIGAPGAGNVIAGGGWINSDANTIQANYFGVRASGTGVFSSSGGGNLLTVQGDGNLIGGAGYGEGNILGGFQDAIWFTGDPTGNTVYGNHVGTDMSGASNLGTNGIWLSGGGNNAIGGVEPGQGNVIAYNDYGVVVSNGSTGNPIRGNTMFANTIDLVPDYGPTANDPLDADTGGNHLQNFPVLGVPLVSTGSTAVTGTLDSAPGQTFDIDFYAVFPIYGSPCFEQSIYNGGGTYIETTTAVTDISGHASFSASLPAELSGLAALLATATDSVGNTSEFSGCVICYNNDLDSMCDAVDPDDDDDDRSDVWELACGTNSLYHTQFTAERTDGAYAGVDDDADTQIDEALPPAASAFDCDGDGYTGTAEDNVFTAAARRDQDPCGTNGWPADFVAGGIPDSTNKITITDLTSFIAPTMHMNTSPPSDPGFNIRWDLSPGAGFFGKVINIADLTSLITVTPPMLSGPRAFNGPACPWAP